MPKKIPFARGFKLPTLEETSVALGPFPFTFADDERRRHQPHGWERPSMTPIPSNKREDDACVGDAGNDTSAFDDLNDK